MARLCKPGGRVVVMGSNALCPEMVKLAEQTEHTYLGMPSKQQPFQPAELSRLLEAAGLQRSQIAPLEGDWETSMHLIAFGEKPSTTAS